MSAHAHTRGDPDKKWAGLLGVGPKGPCPCECDDLAAAWTSSASAHPATSLLALPVVSSLPLVSERRGMWGEELSQCPGHPPPRLPGPQASGRVVALPTGCLPDPELGAFTLPELIL